MLGSIMGTALQGLQQNQTRLAGHARNISRWGTATETGPEAISLETELTGVLMARRGAEANLAVVRAADDMLGTLIDVLA